MVSARSKGSPGDNILFGYTQVHSVCFQILINTLGDSGSQTLILGALPGTDPTPNCMEKGKRFASCSFVPCWTTSLVQAVNVKAMRQDLEGKSNILDVSGEC